jgi:predicted ArsR family transcriptional regulator
MVTKNQVLGFISGCGRQGRAVSCADVAAAFLGMSEGAARNHLERLWRAGLIESLDERPAGFRFRPEPGESLRALRFRIARRGLERLRWYRSPEPDALL